MLSVRADQIATSVSDLGINLSSRITQTSDRITAEVSRAQSAESSLRVGLETIELSVVNLEESVQSDIEILSDKIELRTTQGQVSSMISVALDEIVLSSSQISLRGNTTINDVLTVDTSGNVELEGSYSSLKLTSSGLNIFTAQSSVASTNITGSEITMSSAILSKTFTVASIGLGTMTIGDSSANVVCATLNGYIPVTRAEFTSLRERVAKLEG